MKRKNLTTIEYAKVLDLLVNSTDKLDEALDEFLLYLKSRELLHKVDSIIKEYILLNDQKEGKSHIVITANSDLDNASIVLIKKALKASVVEKKIDKNIIGGIRVETSDVYYDLTVNNQIKKLRQILSKE